MFWNKPVISSRSRPWRHEFVIFFLASLLLCSCAQKEVVRQPGPQPYEGQVTVEVLKNSIGFRDTKTIKALTDVRIYRHGEPVASFSGVFGYQAPELLKTSFFGPFGLTVMDMLIAKDLLQVHLPSKGTLYELESPVISFSSLVNGSFRYSIEDEGDFYLLNAFNASDSESAPAMKYYFDRTYLLNRRVIIYKEGKEMVGIDFDGFNGMLPEKTRLSFAKGMEMEIVLKEPEYDTPIPSDYFRRIDHADNKILPFQDLLRRFAPNR